MEPTTVDRRRISMSLLRLAVVVLVFALVGLRLGASEGGFTATLAPEEQLAAGLAKLSSAEQTALNALVARELSAARAGGVTAFAGTFVSRRRAEERTLAGLDRLAPAEQAQLDVLVAAALAARPVRRESESASRLARADTSVKDPRQLEVHGEISFLYGWGRGGDFKGGSFSATLTDPANRYTIGLGFSHFEGPGFFPRGFDPETDWLLRRH